MIPPPFEYRAPESLPEALALLREHGGEARLMAGGQSLLPMLKLRLVRPAVIIDIAGLEELKDAGKDAVAASPGTLAPEDAGALRIGALVTERTLERALAERQPLLAEAAASIGDIHIRNLGTLGGALSQADPSGDLAPAVLALGATLTAQSARGSRAIAAGDFFTGPYDTCLADDEMVTSVDVPDADGARGHAYVKLARRAGDYAVVGAAALVSLSPDGVLPGRPCRPLRGRCHGLRLRGRGRGASRDAAHGRRPVGSRRAGREGRRSRERRPRVGGIPAGHDPGGGHARAGQGP